MSKRDRLRSFLLILTVFLLLCACTAQQTTVAPTQSPELETYHTESIPLQENAVVTQMSKIDGHTLLLLVEREGVQSVERMDLETMQELTVFLPSESERIVNIGAVPNGADFWMLTETAQDGGKKLLHMDAQGVTSVEVPLFSWDENRSAAGLQVSDTGNVYLYWRDCEQKAFVRAGLYGYSADGAELFALDNLPVEGLLLSEPAGNVILVVENKVIYGLDGDGAALTERFTLPAPCDGLLSAEKDTLYGCAGDILYRYGESEAEPILSLRESGVESGAFCETILPMQDNSYMLLASASLQWLRPGPTPEVQDTRNVITIGTLYSSAELTAAVREFNEKNPDYRAEMIDYSSYGSSEDLAIGLNLFRTQMVAGSGPDIIAFGVAGNSDQSGIDADTLFSAGLLLDLSDFLDQDPELTRAAIYPGLLAALESESGIFQLPAGFYIRTATASADVVGQRNGWTFSDMQAVAESMPNLEYAFGSSINRRRLMEILLSFNSFIDYSTGECVFDSPEFLAMLEFLKDCSVAEAGQQDIPAYAVAAGRQLLGVAQVGSVVEMQEYEETYDNLVFIGVPTASGTGTAFSLVNSLGISAASQKTEGAWEFIKMAFMGGYTTGFPANGALLEMRLESPEQFESWDMIIGYETEARESWEFKLHEPDAGDSQRTRELIALADRLYHPDAAILDIVWEEAETYFDGTKSLEEVAKLIQNRVQIYVGEQV